MKSPLWLLVVVSLALPAHAQIPGNKRSHPWQMFGDATLSPSQLNQGTTLYGISGGTTEAQAIAGIKTSETGDCIGFVDRVPDHRLTLTEATKFLKLQIKSSGDTVLIVKGPGGTWCSDDVRDRNPIIAGEWLRGTYSIWVGSYEPNASFPYLLEISGQKP
jgi:hypothetical protein